MVEQVAEQVVEQVAEQVAEQAVEQAVEQVLEQVVEQALEQALEQAVEQAVVREMVGIPAQVSVIRGRETTMVMVPATALATAVPGPKMELGTAKPQDSDAMTGGSVRF